MSSLHIPKIVITGGPCAGKTSAMRELQTVLTQIGYTVLFVPEIATELISGGIAPWTCATTHEYEKCQMLLQMKKEELYTSVARNMKGEKKLIVCDRGVMDCKAYVSKAEFDALLQDIGKDEVTLRDDYDAVFHLVTAAKGAEEFYTTSNNAARSETVEEAAALDDRTLFAWTGNPHLRVIANEGSFQDKIRHLISEILCFLGEPEPLEIERKFLIEYPDIEMLSAMPNCEMVEIEQTYLAAAEGVETRVRKRGIADKCVYFETTKKPSEDGMKRVEIERKISAEEYDALLRTADPANGSIRKNRFLLCENNQYFELDVYPFWDDKAIVELELSDPDAQIRFPEWMRILREVTDDPSYKNASLAKGKIPE